RRAASRSDVHQDTRHHDGRTLGVLPSECEGVLRARRKSHLGNFRRRVGVALLHPADQCSALGQSIRHRLSPFRLRLFQRLNGRFFSLDVSHAGNLVIAECLVVLLDLGFPVDAGVGVPGIRRAAHIFVGWVSARPIRSGTTAIDAYPVRRSRINKIGRLLGSDVGDLLTLPVQASVVTDGRYDLDHGLTPRQATAFTTRKPAPAATWRMSHLSPYWT